MKKKHDKVLVIIGATATGKTALAVRLACALNGEIISADSRQVYRGMDVGTGKDLGEYTVPLKSKKLKSGQNFVSVPYHCIDIVSPRTEFNLAKWLKIAKKAVADVQQRGKLPIVVGGTGLYVQALIDGYSLGAVAPNRDVRKRLASKSVAELQAVLRALDPVSGSISDNKRHLIRYIEMCQTQHKPLQAMIKKSVSPYDVLVLGTNRSREEIKQRISKRLIQRIEQEGMIEEVARLHKQGVAWKRLESFGLEYRFVSAYLQGGISRDELVVQLTRAIQQFAKRQMTWWRRWERQGREIAWVHDYAQTKKMVGEWLRK